MKLSALAMGGAMALFCACSAPSDHGPRFSGFADETLWVSEHFRYHAHAHDTWVCQATLDELEANYRQVAGYLGTPLLSDRPIDYFRFQSQRELNEAGVCPLADVACTVDNVIYADDLANQHELAHAYFAGTGQPPLFAEEGLAVVLSCDRLSFTADMRGAAAALDATFLLAWTKDPATLPSYYVAAAGLVHFLLERFGPSKLLDYRRSAAADPAVTRSAFNATFGIAIEEALSSAKARIAAGRFCWNGPACAAPAIELGAAPHPVGETCGVAATFRTFTVTNPQAVALSLRGGGSLQVFACDNQGDAPSTTKVGRMAGGGGGTLLVHLAAGKYALRHGGTPQVSKATVWVASAESGWLAPTCADGLAFPFDESPNELSLAVPGRTGTWFGRFTLPEPGELSWSTTGLPAAENAMPFCPSCTEWDGPGACLAGNTPRLPAGSYAVTIPSDEAQSEYAAVQVTRSPPLAARRTAY